MFTHGCCLSEFICEEWLCNRIKLVVKTVFSGFLISGHSLRTKLAAMQVLESVLPACKTTDTAFQKQVSHLIQVSHTCIGKRFNIAQIFKFV